MSFLTALIAFLDRVFHREPMFMYQRISIVEPRDPCERDMCK